jgi:putative hydrolase of the HAD superfamily
MAGGKIRHLLFDIDDTLFPSGEFSALARRNALNAMIGMGLDYDLGELGGLLTDIIGEKGPNYPGHFDELCSRIGVKEPAKYVAAAVAAYHDTKTSIAPYPAVPLTLLRLREAGYRLHVATQGNAIKQWDKLIRLRIALYFERVFVSDKPGEGKGAAFYRRTHEALCAKAAECLMIGDREDADILPAMEVGMKTAKVLTGRQAGMPTKADYTARDVSGLIPILLGRQALGARKSSQPRNK